MSADLLSHGGGEGSALSQTALLVGLTAGVATAYFAGVGRLLTANPTSSWAWRRWSFALGLTVLVVATLPQLEPVVERSFPAHMVQHTALLLVVAPLLALGRPGVPLLLALPRKLRRRVAAIRSSAPGRRGRAALTLPAVVVTVHVAVVLAWHLPTLYSAALTSTAVHVTEHAAFLAVGWWFWSLVTSPVNQLDGRTVLYIAATGVPMNGLGAMLTFAPTLLYPEQTGTGSDALVQQQLAGLLMWVPAGAVYLTICAVVVLLWLRRLDRESPADVPLPPPVPPQPVPAGVLMTREGKRR